MKRFGLIVLFISLIISGIAQNKGSLTVDQDNRINTLMTKQAELFALDNTSEGYRVQIFMEIGNDAVTHAYSVKQKFEDAHPDIPVYLTYDQPYYRLRVGDFRNRVEAEKCLYLIKQTYSEAFVTADLIFPPQFKSSSAQNADAEEQGD